jgi:3-oxoacyl-[acyl-carrier protein] reductase
MDLGLRGKVALVEGASRGIGKAVAMGLAREGCLVAICARNEPPLLAAADEIRSATGVDVLALSCDMARAEDIERFVAGTVERFGRMDIVVNNAGGPPLGAFERHSDEAWQAALEQNFLSAVRTIRAALPHLRKQGGGRIINITSYAVKQPLDGLILSNSARLAVIGLAKTLSRELGPDNILVNNVCPGPTLTDRMQSLMRSRAENEGRPYEEVVAEENKRIPLGHMGTAEDVAALVVFLASEPARHITGTTIQVDGGATASIL